MDGGGWPTRGARLGEHSMEVDLAEEDGTKDEPIKDADKVLDEMEDMKTKS